VDPTRGADAMPVRIQSRPKGIRPRDAPLPKGLDGRKVVAILTGSNYQVASRIWLDAGRELALRVIVDTGSGVSLVREALLPPEMKVAPLDVANAQLFDVNGGLLPITGTVTLTVRIGTYSTQVTCGVVRGMSVPLLSGTDYTDVHVPNICGPKGCIQVIDGCKVPIHRRGKTVSFAKANQPGKASAASEADANVRLAREVVLPPRSRGYVPVQMSFQGNGVITQRHQVYERHCVHVATGSIDCTANQTWWVEVTHTGSTSKRLPEGMVLGHMSAYSGTVAAISREEWASLSPSPATAPDVTDPVEEPHVHTSSVPEGLRPQVLSLLEKHRALWSGHLGSIKATEHRIELKPGSKPVRLNPYRMGPRTRELIEAPVDRILKLEVIEPSQSEWASPVVLIQKPDGSHRFCIDYQQLNERTVRDTYPLPRMDDCLDSLGDAQFFSMLDSNAGYWQIPIAEEDKPKTAFTCHCGTYQCTRLPFGLCNAPAAFQRAIDMILAGVNWQNALVYLDDLIIFSADAESHLSHLDTVLALLGKHGVTLKAQKCHLFSNEVEYLGHVVRPGRLSMNEKNLKAIKKAVFPKTQTQLRSFLGMCNVYRRFTVDFAKIAKPLNDLNSLKLPKRLSPPTPEEQAAFDKLREQLSHPPILAIPRKEGKYIIDVDASYDQLGCCLLQQQPDDKYLTVGYFSKGLLPAEKNYAVTEIE